MVDIFSDFLREKVSKEEIEVSDRQLEQLKVYFNDLIKWNQIINLTSLKDPEEIIVKHFIDSLMLLKHINFSYGATIMDVGTGAGFPGLVLKIMRPDLRISLLDSLNSTDANSFIPGNHSDGIAFAKLLDDTSILFL